jgi:hypothetical protein
VRQLLFHLLLLYMFQRSCPLVIRICGPERIDGNRATSIPALVLGALVERAIVHPRRVTEHPAPYAAAQRSET